MVIDASVVAVQGALYRAKAEDGDGAGGVGLVLGAGNQVRSAMQFDVMQVAAHQSAVLNVSYPQS